MKTIARATAWIKGKFRGHTYKQLSPVVHKDTMMLLASRNERQSHVCKAVFSLTIFNPNASAYPMKHVKWIGVIGDTAYVFGVSDKGDAKALPANSVTNFSWLGLPEQDTQIPLNPGDNLAFYFTYVDGEGMPIRIPMGVPEVKHIDLIER